MKMLLLRCLVILGCGVVGWAGLAVAADKGPATMTLRSTVDPATTPKPALFPHGEHQSRLACATCHHGKDAAGKQVPYVEGQKIEKCEVCHNTKAGIAEKVNTFKNAAHERCRNCHKEKKPELAQCTVCHK